MLINKIYILCRHNCVQEYSFECYKSHEQCELMSVQRWNDLRTTKQGLIHTPFIDKIFIAFSYWVDYRPGLHLLTLWNMNHVLLWGEEDKQGDGRKDGNTITENSKFPYDCELMLFDWGPACMCLCWWRDVFKSSFWCSLWPLTRTYSSTQGLHHKTNKGFNQMSEREGRTEQKCHVSGCKSTKVKWHLFCQVMTSSQWSAQCSDWQF